MVLGVKIHFSRLYLPIIIIIMVVVVVVVVGEEEEEEHKGQSHVYTFLGPNANVTWRTGNRDRDFFFIFVGAMSLFGLGR